jgi:5-formyltetrahydrofolate cyclo-ligase
MAETQLIRSEKIRLRRQIRNRLENLDMAERNYRSSTICEKLAPKFLPGLSVALFAPTRLEPDIDLLWEMSRPADGAFLYPRCEESGLKFVKIGALADLLPGRFGIREPKFAPSSIVPDLVVVPGLAFTRDGSRLGRGGGFYDRYLRATPERTVKIGVCFQFQIVESIPCEAHDISMDEIVCG